MIQFLPTQDLSALSARARITYEKATEGSLGWGQILTLLVPKFFGVSDAHAYTYWGPGPYWHYWETSIYFGVAPLLLALFSLRFFRRNRHIAFFSLFALFSLLFSLGQELPPPRTLLRSRSGLRIVPQSRPHGCVRRIRRFAPRGRSDSMRSGRDAPEARNRSAGAPRCCGSAARAARS